GGKVVDIRAVDVQRVGPYLSKYLGKDFGREFPPRKRRYTSSRGVKMALRGRGGKGWVLVRLWEERLVSVCSFDFLDSLRENLPLGSGAIPRMHRGGLYFERQNPVPMWLIS
ncbi:MAG: hypothetical protein QW356_08265, partial [Candidatus Hadarchaeales archaeon]